MATRRIKFLRLASILPIIVIMLAPPSFAQSLSIRSSETADYSRLVLAWPQRTNFELQKPSEDRLTLTFSANASPDTSSVNVEALRNIGGIAVETQTPLSITLSIPAGAEHRARSIGNRTIIDILTPENGATPKPLTGPISATQPKPEQETSSSPQEEPPAETRAAVPIEQVEENAIPKKQEDERPLAGIMRKPGDEPDLISFSSSRSIGLAVFERGERLYMVNDQGEILTSPQASGPNAALLSNFETQDLQGAKLFKTPRMQGAEIRTQGGGLLWKIILTDKPRQDTATEPKRNNVIEGQGRSGSLLWPFVEPGKVVEMTDPVTGFPIKIVTTKTPRDFDNKPRHFVDFDVIPAAAGLVIMPRRDGVNLSITDEGVVVTHPEGLAISSETQIKTKLIRKHKPKKTAKTKAKPKTLKDPKKIYDFKNWQLGGEKALRDNQTIILASLNGLPDSARSEGLMSLAKMFLSNGMGAEALGFLRMVENSAPEISKTPEFLAIRGAARALDMKTSEAFKDLSIASLNRFEEIGFWRAFALADLGDWQQAIAEMPKDPSLLDDYPETIFNKIALVAAEIALRDGNVGMADKLLMDVQRNEESLRDKQKAALAYFKGEAARQDGDLVRTVELWRPLITGADDLYRARAGLALTRLLVDTGQIKHDEAIDNLERLRYSWRGDDLEGQISYWLGWTYFEQRDYVKGLNVLREAASFTAGTKLGNRITSEMRQVFINLYTGNDINRLSPLDAVALYDQFTELVPADERGNQIVENLADRLVKVDLLARASELLNYQLTHRLSGLEAYNVGTKLAAVYLSDERPDAAITALDKAQGAYDTLSQDQKTADKMQTMALLRARAISRQGRPDQAIAMLEALGATPSVNRLRADIAWSAGYWDDAAAALQDVILDENISLTRPLNKDRSTLILNRAIALNLASDRISLANMREKYSDAMAQTEKARIFDVITRPRQNRGLADRDTLLDIVSEVDLFSDFLENYRTVTSNEDE